MNRKKLVLIGNGMAGISCIEEILRLDPSRYSISIFGAEKFPNYNRILLSKVLQGDTAMESIILNPLPWYEENGLHLHLGKPICHIHRDRKQVVTADGNKYPYDVLLLATGSHPIMLPLPGKEKSGVIAFRNIDDCQAMITAAKEFKRAAVIGGGLLGLEAARGLLNLGMETQVVHLLDRLMERQLDKTASQLLKKSLEAQGMQFLLEKDSAEILGNGRVTGLRFKDGSETPADLVVMAVGIRPNTDLAEKTGIACERGIVVSDILQTSDPSVYALGECAAHRGIAYGLVAPLFEQAKVLANQLAGDGRLSYGGSVVATKLKVSGVDVFSAGDFIEQDNDETVEFKEGKQIYKKLVFRDEKLVGAVLFGDTREGPSLFEQIRGKKPVPEKRAELLFANLSLGDTGHSGSGQATAMSDDATICGCNGVTKEMIICAIKERGLFTREEVKDCTKASRSCGGCGPLVDELLMAVHGADHRPDKHVKPLCKCTTYSRDEVVKQIRDKHLTHAREVMHVLGWESEGCNYCRPALNYFVKMLWPKEHLDDPNCRIANERNHANIQKDGTYSVVPRIYAGVTSAAQLRRISEVAEKYKVPMLKITGGQRIDLLGIKKEDLPQVWADLDMPSGYAYAKALRTVKSCVGTEFCRYGVQDSTTMAIDLEKKFECLNTPAKVKLAVSGCPRNCAESSIKDLGVVGIDGGWELYVGGNGGVHVRAGDILCTVKTHDEVMEIAAAYLQYYRETANYFERSSVWLERIGLDAIKCAVVDDRENRKALVARMETALDGLEDPWMKLKHEKSRFQALTEQKDTL